MGLWERIHPDVTVPLNKEIRRHFELIHDRRYINRFKKKMLRHDLPLHLGSKKDALLINICILHPAVVLGQFN